MRAPETRWPVGIRTADGFRVIGHLGAGGIQTPPKAQDVEKFAWGDRVVRTLQSQCAISFEMKFGDFDSLIWWALFDPQAAAAVAFRRIDPHWYPRGGDDD
ncbi:MAG: hypothetical protein CK431_04440 [Mycobacterium sp.]|nr:MAG: hypothetical protein CK431_04440 [Mycobacterium sp.]